MKVIIKKNILEMMKEHAEVEYPCEACGLLGGSEGIIKKIYRMRNASENPGQCYMMDPREQLGVFKEMRKEGIELLGIYHSHIEVPAYPSQRDKELAFYSEALYFILGVRGGKVSELRAYTIRDKRIEEVEFDVEE